MTIFILACGWFLYFLAASYNKDIGESVNHGTVEFIYPSNARINVDRYIRENISSLSTEEEILGGKFYVTRVVFETDTRAIVEYEDGHNALKALVEVYIQSNGDIKLLNFTIIGKN